jgi:drug/metabolite transporter (DMT)-like permease
MKLGLKFFSPWQVATIRLVSAFIILIGFAVADLRKIPISRMGYVILSALLVMFIPAYLFCYAETGISSAVAGILNALTPFFTLVFGVLFFRQPILRMQVGGLIIGFIGILFLTLFNAKGELVFNHFAVFVIAASICYGLNIQIIKTYLSDVNPFHLTTASVSIAGFFSLLYVLFSGGFQILPVTDQNRVPLIASVTLGIVGTAMAQLLFNMVIKRSSAIFASSIIYALPIVAVFWGVFDNESIMLWHYIGMICIVAGIIVMRHKATK